MIFHSALLDCNIKNYLLALGLIVRMMDPLQAKANYSRVCQLLIDKGGDALRRVLQTKVHTSPSPSTLDSLLNAHKKSLQKIRYSVINAAQWKLLFPALAPADAKNFDITLLTILLRNICGLPSPTAGWNVMPAASDTSISAEILRIKMLRNEVYGHISCAQLDDTKFETLWQEISKPLVKLGIAQQDIDELKGAPLSPEEKTYIQKLEEWKELEDDLLSRFSDLQAAFTRLRKVVENVNLPPTDKLAKFDFTGKIENLCKKSQVGTRQWFFDILSSWFRDDESKVLIVTAGPGVGKSVLSAKVCEMYQKTGQLAANHFCDFQASDCSDPYKILQSLASQMCDNLDGFRDKLTEALTREHSRDSLSDTFRVLLNDPLHALDRNAPMLIVVDALDESKSANKSDLLNLISSEFSRLPKCIKILITSRPELDVRKKLEHLNPLEILPDNKKHELDLEHFICCSLNLDISYCHSTIRLLVSKCEGSFLYAYYLVSDIKQKGLMGIESDVNNYNPKGISGFYEQQFERLKIDLQQYNQITEVSIFKIFVNVVAASETPLPFSILFKCMCLSNLEFEIRKTIMGLMSEILPVYDDCLTVFHKSLWDWLKLDGYKEHACAADIADGEKRLWDACKKVYRDIDSLCSVSDFQISCQEMYVLTNGWKYLVNVGDTGNFHWLVNVKVNFLKLKFCNNREKLVRNLHLSTQHFDFFDILQNYRSELQDRLYWLLSQHVAFCMNMGHLFSRGNLYGLKDCYIYLEDVANGRIGLFQNSVACQSTAKDILNKTNKIWLEEATNKSSSTFKVISHATFGRNWNICSMTSSPNNKLLVCIHKKRVEVFEIPSLTIAFKLLLKREIFKAQSIVFSPDSSYFLTNSLRTCVSIKEQKEVPFILNGPAEICCCSFSSCGTKIVSFEDESIKLWDVRRKVLLASKYYGCSISIREIVFFSNCNSYIFLCDQSNQTIEMLLDSTTLEGIAIENAGVCTHTHFTNNDCIKIISKSGYEKFDGTTLTIENSIRITECYQFLNGINILFPNVYCSQAFPWKGRNCVICSNSSYGALSLLVCDFVKQEVVDAFEISCLSGYNVVNYISYLTETNFLICLNGNSAVVMSLQGSPEFLVAPLFLDDGQELVPLFCVLSPENCYIACSYASRILRIMSITNGETLQTIVLKRKPIACWWSESYLWMIFPGPEVVKSSYDPTNTKILETEFEECFFECRGHVLKFAEGVLVVRLDGGRVCISKICANSFSPPKIFDCDFVAMAAISSDGHAVLLYDVSNYMLWETECEDKWKLVSTRRFGGIVDRCIAYGCVFDTKKSGSFIFLANQNDFSCGYNLLYSIDFSNGSLSPKRTLSETGIVWSGGHIYLDVNFLVFYNYEDGEIHFFYASNGKIITSLYVGDIDFFFFSPEQQRLLLFSGYDIKHFKIHNLENNLIVPL